MPTGIPLTKELKEHLIKYYTSKPMTISDCAKHYTLSTPTVTKILDEYGIQRYTKAKIKSPDLDEHYFQNIDTEEKAYFLGFILTDGNVFKENGSSNRQSSVSITQSDKDKYILEKFLKEVGSTASVRNDGRGACQAAVRSDIMAKDLEQYGICANKTFNTYLPIIDKKLMPHLIRGILDGDGNITSLMTSKNKHKHTIAFCGTSQLMNDLAMFLSDELNILKPAVYTYNNRHLSEVKWQSIYDCQVLGEWLYKDATIYLTRKKQKFEDFKQHYNL